MRRVSQGPSLSFTRRQPEQLQQEQQAPARPLCTGATTRPAAVCPRPGAWGLHPRSLQSHSSPTPHRWWLQPTAPPAGSPLQWGSPAARDPPPGAAQASLAQSHLLCKFSLRVQSKPLLKAAQEALALGSQKCRPLCDDLRDAEESS